VEIKTRVKYYLAPVSTATIRKRKVVTGVVKDAEKRMLQCWWKCKLVKPLWKTA
jgi:hypothetical protein